MPNIRTYDQQVEAPRANMGGMRNATAEGEAAGAFGAGVAGGLGEFGAKISAYQEQNETSKLSANLAITQANLTNKWQDTIKNADPNDPDVAKNFLENEVAPALDKVGEGLGTAGARDMYSKARAGLQANFMVKAHSDQSELAGVAAVQNYVTAKNQLTSATLSDPTSFETNMSLGNLVIDGMKNIPVEKRLELKTGLAKEQANAHIVGIANNDPAAAEKELNSGKFDKFMDSADKTALKSHITALADAKKSAANQERIEQRRQAKQDAEDQSAAILKDAVKVGPDGFHSIDPAAFKAALAIQDPAEQRATFDTLKSIQKASQEGVPIKTDAPIFMELISRLGKPADDPAHLTPLEARQYIGNGITVENYNFLDKQMKAPGVGTRAGSLLLTQTLNDVQTKMGAKQTFGMPPPDAGAVAKYTAWLGQFTQMYQAGLEGGKTPIELLNADSKDYLPVLKGATTWTGPGSYGGLSQFPLTLSHPGTTPIIAPPATAARKKQLDDIMMNGVK